MVLLIAMLIGTVVGISLGYGLLQLMLQLIPNLQIEFSAIAMLLGPLPVAMLTSAVVLLGFVMPSLLQLLNTPPIRVIRQQEKSVQSMLWMLLTGTLSLIIFSVILTENLAADRLGDWRDYCVMCSAVSDGMGMLKLLRNMKLNLSAYVRTPSQTALQITALALGLSLITVLAVLRTDLLDRWQQQLPEGTPNQFVYGLPPFDMPDLKAQLEQNGWKSTPLYPNVRGRLVAKNDQPFAEELVKSSNTLRRELNLTQSNRYPQDNVIVSGDAVLKQVGTVSVEANTAEELGIKIGDKLDFSSA